MAEPMTGTLSSTKYPFSPKNMYSMDVWKRAKSQVRSTGSINYVRLGYWRIVASHSDSTTGKRRQRKKCARPKKKNKALSARSSIILYHTGPHKALSVDHQTPFTSQRLFRLLVYPGSNTCRISSHSTFVTSICFT